MIRIVVALGLGAASTALALANLTLYDTPVDISPTKASAQHSVRQLQQAAAGAPAASGNNSFAETLERPLFTPTRRKFIPAADGARPVQPASDPLPQPVPGAILVTGATGRVGRQVVQQLVKRGADVRVLVRDISKADFPAVVEVVQGELLDIDSLRKAFAGINTLFLLNAVSGDEFTQALITLNIARESGLERVVYLSVIHSDRFVNVPHFAVKSGAERMIEQMGFSATILRPAYFIDNELMIKDVIFNHGVYPMPIGAKGIAMVDARDIAEVAAVELIRRDQAPGQAADRNHQSGRPRYADWFGCSGDLVGCPGPPDCLWRR